MQLAHGGIDDRDTGLPLLPGLEFIRRVAPGQGLGFRAEGAVHRDPRVANQNMLVELPPEQFVDPGHQAPVATVELAKVVA
ncbi:hypothetical protein D3C76_1791690 [compost metagenome]